MNRLVGNFVLALVVGYFALSALSWGVQDKTDVDLRLENATAVLKSIMNAPEKGVPEEIISGAKCIAIFPHLLKGGFIFGAKRGRGIVTCRLPDGAWSAPAFMTITGADWGAQIGVEGIDLIMMFMTEQGARHLMEAKFQIGGEVSAAAGPVGRHASAGIDWKADTQILTYSRAKGAFAGITIGGSYVEPDRASTEAVYGRPVSVEAILTGRIHPPRDPQVQAFLTAVRSAQLEASAKKHQRQQRP